MQPKSPRKSNGVNAIEINGQVFRKTPGVTYPRNYLKLKDVLAKAKAKGESVRDTELAWYRWLMQNDLWFLVTFGFGVPIELTNCRHWVESCDMVQTGPVSHTLDVWGREHGKSTIITQAGSLQDVLNDPETTCAIFSYAKPAAIKHMRPIKQVCEGSEFVQACFPDILYENPGSESTKWSEAEGLFVKRRGNQGEPTFSAFGLTEGMPTGGHYSLRVYDDVVTQDLVGTPEMIAKIKENFDMSQNLGTVHGRHRVIGTYYHHDDPLVYIRSKRDPITQDPIYLERKITSTTDGTFNGPSRYLPEKRLAELRTNRYMFATQHLLDPTPVGERALNPESLIEIDPKDIPSRLYRFMDVDPAGTEGKRVKGKKADAWGMMVFGVEPYLDDVGASDLYILDLFIDVCDHAQAMRQIVAMYLRGGRILKLGVEKVGQSSAEIHVASALRARGRMLSVESGSLQVLRPAGRKKEFRIESNLSWPLANGKIKISTAIPKAFRERLKLELEKFPFWHDDGLDLCAYAYDMIADYRFGRRPPEDETRDPYADDGDELPKENGWMTA